VFSEVTGSALRLLQVPPDQLDRERDIGFARPLVAKRGGL
jgi:hypothetical protein